jgi:hypothetical protein
MQHRPCLWYADMCIIVTVRQNADEQAAGHNYCDTRASNVWVFKWSNDADKMRKFPLEKVGFNGETASSVQQSVVPPPHAPIIETIPEIEPAISSPKKSAWTTFEVF